MGLAPGKEPVIYVVEPFGGSPRRHLPSLPLVYADDAAVTRGDGVFESLLVRDGVVAGLERHARRFAASARALDLPAPILEDWVKATGLAVADYGEGGDAKCTWTFTRGRASTGRPSAWIVVQPLEDEVLRQRAEGVAAMLTPRSWQVPEELPAKTLNYAATMATLRLARSRGFDDVIFTDPSSGLVLEGATSSVLAVKGKKMRAPSAAGILPGTTQAALFELATERGFRCKAREMDEGYLRGADSVWLISSVRTGVRVHRLGESRLNAPANEEEVRALIDAACARP